MARRGSTKILVVEDDEPVRALIRAMLLQSGYEILEAANGEEALALWESSLDAITAVLTDVVMPRMGGLELARRIKEATPDTAVIFISGYSDDPVVQEAAGMDCGFLPKPFTMPELTKALRGALENGQRR
jgi:two-component system, cell cycle sensor histidine kinase and response regulator CckA